MVYKLSPNMIYRFRSQCRSLNEWWNKLHQNEWWTTGNVIRYSALTHHSALLCHSSTALTVRGEIYGSDEEGRGTQIRAAHWLPVLYHAQSFHCGSFPVYMSTLILTYVTHVNGWDPAVYRSYMSHNFVSVAEVNVLAFCFYILM